MGNIQASGYIARYFGSALGAIGGAVLYNKDTWGWGLSISTLFWINGLVPLFLVLPLMPFLIEYPKAKDTLKKHTDELWALVQKKAVWRPMTFVYIYNVLMVRENKDKQWYGTRFKTRAATIKAGRNWRRLACHILHNHLAIWRPIQGDGGI